MKPRYSAFDLTPLELVLEQYGIEQVLRSGTAAEMCVTQTAIDATERELEVTVLPELARRSTKGRAHRPRLLPRRDGAHLAATLAEVVRAPSGSPLALDG